MKKIIKKTTPATLKARHQIRIAVGADYPISDMRLIRQAIKRRA